MQLLSQLDVAGLLPFIAVGFGAQLVDGALGMAFGVICNTLLVAVMGVGVGIDYGIYLLSRICEEFTAVGHDWEKAITNALTTTGKAIMFTATIMLAGILPWYFLSDLKFLSDMGLLLVMVMTINMVISLLVLPLLVWWIKPRFIASEHQLISEKIDYSAHAAGLS